MIDEIEISAGPFWTTCGTAVGLDGVGGCGGPASFLAETKSPITATATAAAAAMTAVRRCCHLSSIARRPPDMLALCRLRAIGSSPSHAHWDSAGTYTCRLADRHVHYREGRSCLVAVTVSVGSLRRFATMTSAQTARSNARPRMRSHIAVRSSAVRARPRRRWQ